MDRTDFIKIIDSDDLSAVIANFFDEIMVLYNLVGGRQDLRIQSDGSATTATFTLIMETVDEAQELYEKLNGTDFRVYGITFGISMDVSENAITTIINQI